MQIQNFDFEIKNGGDWILLIKCQSSGFTKTMGEYHPFQNGNECMNSANCTTLSELELTCDEYFNKHNTSHMNF